MSAALAVLIIASIVPAIKIDFIIRLPSCCRRDRRSCGGRAAINSVSEHPATMKLRRAAGRASPLLGRVGACAGLVISRQTFVRRCHGTEKAPTIKGRGKLAERIEVEFGPFRSACIA